MDHCRVLLALGQLTALLLANAGPAGAQDCSSIPNCSSCTFRRVGTSTRMFCTFCSAGYVVTSDQRTCVCAPGFYWNADASACQLCGIGAWCVVCRVPGRRECMAGQRGLVPAWLGRRICARRSLRQPRRPARARAAPAAPAQARRLCGAPIPPPASALLTCRCSLDQVPRRHWQQQPGPALHVRHLDDHGHHPGAL
jgi:hypothetical protein